VDAEASAHGCTMRNAQGFQGLGFRVYLNPKPAQGPAWMPYLYLPAMSECSDSVAEVFAAISPVVCSAKVGANLAPLIRGLHSSTFQLNMSAFSGIGGERRDCVARVKGVLGGV
jgi:hypothetical protein